RDIPNGERIVAEEIIRVKRRGDKLVLSDILGVSKVFKGFIDEVDVSKEHIRLSNDPFLTKLAELLGLYYKYLEGGGRFGLEETVKELRDASQRLLDSVKGL
ncbi:MAG: CooT family nickel-binding protein, partial [Candidatus Bathyarchaeia archaeon]